MIYSYSYDFKRLLFWNALFETYKLSFFTYWIQHPKLELRSWANNDGIQNRGFTDCRQNGFVSSFHCVCVKNIVQYRNGSNLNPAYQI